ncbi:hypothetical protein HKX48_000211 [Thoreauomyces humboldtii]|nr:hypothetical protein HKX48_000211 [Thoreauomyces humboldtii]
MGAPDSSRPAVEDKVETDAPPAYANSSSSSEHAPLLPPQHQHHYPSAQDAKPTTRPVQQQGPLTVMSTHPVQHHQQYLQPQPLQEQQHQQPQAYRFQQLPHHHVPTILVVDTRRPIPMHCPFCNLTVTTRVTEALGAKAWISTLFLCVFFPLASCLPLCMPSCHDKVHRCPNCTAVLATLAA